jgi:hypothetical protein
MRQYIGALIIPVVLTFPVVMAFLSCNLSGRSICSGRSLQYVPVVLYLQVVPLSGHSGFHQVVLVIARKRNLQRRSTTNNLRCIAYCKSHHLLMVLLQAERKIHMCFFGGRHVQNENKYRSPRSQTHSTDSRLTFIHIKTKTKNEYITRSPNDYSYTLRLAVALFSRFSTVEGTIGYRGKRLEHWP